MGNIKPKELKRLGYTDDIARSMVTEIVAKHCKHMSEEEIIATLQDLQKHPESYKDDNVWRKVAEVLSPSKAEVSTYELRATSLPFTIYGAENIDQLAKSQMEMAMRLPITVSGALMPDGCAGYGLPIGGVLATTDDVVIPYAVGKDIGCRMSLTILDAEADFLEKHQDRAVEALINNTAFGLDGIVPYKQYHPLFDRSEFKDIPILKKLRDKAVRQLGSSGKGNHFVDICEVELPQTNALKLPDGKYIGILSHSGSRGLGAAIADYYTTIAKETCKLPRQAGPFAWLSLNTEAGQEYWINVSNHHNFAWRERLPDGREIIIHRKGATPAHLGELGIIPGSMATLGYIVSGKGNAESLFSASHGAGRTMSRLDARNSISRYALKKYLAENDVTLIGGTPEEAPQAYKDINKVIESQKELVNIEGMIIPRIVRMSED